MVEVGGRASVKTTCSFVIKKENGIYERLLYGLRVKMSKACL